VKAEKNLCRRRNIFKGENGKKAQGDKIMENGPMRMKRKVVW